MNVRIRFHEGADEYVTASSAWNAITISNGCLVIQPEEAMTSRPLRHYPLVNIKFYEVG